MESKNADDSNSTRPKIGATVQGVWRLFIVVFDNTDNGNKKI